MTTHDTIMAQIDRFAMQVAICTPEVERKARAALSAAIAELIAERDEHKSNAMRNARSAVTFKAERDQAVTAMVEISRDARATFCGTQRDGI